MLVQASRDRQLCDVTYLPAQLEDDDVPVWAGSRPGPAWVVLDDGCPVGWFELGPVHDPCGITLPAGTWELELWLVPQARRRRLLSEVVHLLRPTLLQRGIRFVVGVAWTSNTAAVTWMHRNGFVSLGSGWWDDGDSAGWCEVALLDLAATPLHADSPVF